MCLLHRVLEHLGSGQFGNVSKGVWNISEDSIQIAIKQLLPKASSTEGVKLLQEAAIMGQFSHPNVVKLYGLMTLGNPVRIIVLFCCPRYHVRLLTVFPLHISVDGLHRIHEEWRLEEFL